MLWATLKQHANIMLYKYGYIALCNWKYHGKKLSIPSHHMLHYKIYLTTECRNCPIRMNDFRELRENLIMNCENVITEILLLHCRFSSWALRVSCTGEFGCFIQQSRIGTGTQMEVSQALRFGKVWPYRVLLKKKKKKIFWLTKCRRCFP